MNFITIFADVVKPIKLKGTGTFNPHKTAIIDEHLSCIRQKDVNFWFYRKNETVIAIDSGYKNEAKLYTDLDSISIKNEDIKAVFITHGDVDHMGGLISDIRFAPNADIYLNEKEVNMIIGEEFRFGKGPIKIKNPVKFTGDTKPFKDNEIIKINDIKIECIPCIGHTKGHTVYLIDKTYLFTGDSIAINQDGGHCFFNFYNMNTKENITSLHKLKKYLSKIQPKVICTAHNGIGDFEQAFSNIDIIAKGRKSKPFDTKAPYNVFDD